MAAKKGEEWGLDRRRSKGDNSVCTLTTRPVTLVTASVHLLYRSLFYTNAPNCLAPTAQEILYAFQIRYTLLRPDRWVQGEKGASKPMGEEGAAPGDLQVDGRGGRYSGKSDALGIRSLAKRWLDQIPDSESAAWR